MGFYHQIELNYGRQAVTKFKSWSKNKQKLAKLLNKRCFLLKCRKEDVIPKHVKGATYGVEKLLQQDSWESRDSHHRKLLRLGNKILSLEISSNQKQILKVESNLNILKNEIIGFTNEHIFLEFSHKQHIKYNRLFHKVKCKNINKFNYLYNSQVAQKLKSQPNWIKNLTNVTIPEDVNHFLALGPKFSIEPILGKDINIRNILADIDYATSTIEDTNLRNNIIARSTNVITNYFHHSTEIKPSLFRKVFNKTRSFLKEHPDIIVTRSDKGNVTVVMYREEYIRLSYELINNDNSYVQINSDPTSGIQTKCNTLIKSLFDKKYIDLQQKRNLTCYNGVIPKFYALPKVHKQTLSVRPIVASLQSPLNPLASYITNILSISYNKNNRYFINDSFEFFNNFNRTMVPNNYVLASLDVRSLFSNIYLDLVLDVIDRRWDCIASHCNIPLVEFKHIISFLFNNTCFMFDNKYFKQTLGTPMGAKVSPVLASFVMDDLLDRIVPTLPFNLFFIKKYVDDLVIALPVTNVGDILEIFNNFDPHIKFTLEVEDDQQSIPFLDTRIIRTNNNMLLIDWYRKPITSGRYINFWSYHKMSIKINLVKQMKNRVLNVSDQSFHIKNLGILMELFTNNSYPKQLLKQILYSTSPLENEAQVVPLNLDQSTNNGVVAVADSTVPFRYISVPYINDVTARLAKILKDVPNIKLANSTVLTVNKVFTNLKCKDNTSNISNIVYSIKCNDCNQIYIGQTGQMLKQRISIHKSDCRLRPDRCALANHANSNKHNMDFGNAKILERQTNKSKRIFLEMAYIFGCDNTINKKTDVKHLSEFYSYLLSMDKIHNSLI